MLHLFTSIIFVIFILTQNSFSSESTAYPDIPRIDVHTHVGEEPEAIANYLKVREMLKDNVGTDLALWINLGNRDCPVPDLEQVAKISDGRILNCISDYSAHNGLDHPTDTLAERLDEGYIGYKIWSGPPSRIEDPKERKYPYIDNPAHQPTFERMEELGMVAASLHVADPNGPWGERTQWLADPVEYWKQILAWRNVLERHPNLVVVNAHAMWSICQDAQIDYLRNVLSTFPNVNIDLAATFQYCHLVTRDNLREFMIDYADRILFGTDIGNWQEETRNSHFAQRYAQCFQILETDEKVPGGFFGQNPTQGLDLPREVLEKIYYKNAMRIYPRVKTQLMDLGYSVE